MEDLLIWEEKFEECFYAKKLLDKVTSLNSQVLNPIDIREIKKAIYYARKYHGGQMRQSGEPYYSHPVEVAYMLAEFTALETPKLYKPYMLQIALLHDTIEDTQLTENLITEIFNQEVASGVESLSRAKPYGKISAAESLNLLFKQKKYDIALIKLFDRIHNIQTLGAKSPEKAKKIIEETLLNFSLLAAYLEIRNIEKQFFSICDNFLKENFPSEEYKTLQISLRNSFLDFQNDANHNNSLLLPVP